MFSPKTFKLVKAMGLSVNCGPSGNALGINETEVLACGNGNGSMLTINAVTGAVLNQVMGPSPDEVFWYSPKSNRFYGADTVGGTLAVLDGNGNLVAARTDGFGFTFGRG